MDTRIDSQKAFHPDFGAGDAWGGSGTWGNRAHALASAVDPSLTLGTTGGLGSLGDSYAPMSSMMGGMFGSDISAGLRGIDRANSGGGNYGGFLSGDYNVGTSFGNFGNGVGSGAGFGYSTWDGQSATHGTYGGQSGGAGAVGSLKSAWDLMGFGPDSNLNTYRGVSGSAYSFQEPMRSGGDNNSIPGKIGIGAEGNYTPFGLVNSAAIGKAGSLGSVKADVGSGYLGKHSVSVQAGKATDGNYFDEAMYAKRTGIDNASASVNSGIGNAKLKAGHASTGDEWKAGGTYNPLTGALEGHGSWTGGGYKVQEGTLDYSVGKDLVKSHSSVGAWDTTDTFSGGAGWDAKRAVAFAKGAGSWGGSTLKDAKFDVATKNKSAWVDGEVGTFVTGGYDVKGGAEADPTTRTLTATGGGRGGGVQLENAKLGYGINRLASIDASLDKFSNDTVVEDAKYTSANGKESLHVGKIDGMGLRFEKADVAAKSDLLGLNSKVGFRSLSNTHSVEGAHVDTDYTSLKKLSAKGGFDHLSAGGLTGEYLHTDINGPLGTNASAKVGSFNQVFGGKDGHFELSSQKGLDVGLNKGRLDAFTMSDVDAQVSLGRLASAQAHVGEGSYNHFAAENANAGLKLDKGVYGGLEKGEYRYLAGNEIAYDASMLGGLVKQSGKLGEGSGGGVDIGGIQYNTTLANTNLTANNVGAHGLKLKDVEVNQSLGKFGAGLGAKQLNALDLNVGKLDAHTQNFGTAGNASFDQTKLDVLNVTDGHAGLAWGSKEALGASGSLRGSLGLNQARGSYDFFAGKADTQFKNASSGTQLSGGRVELFGNNIAIPDMGYKANASGGGSMDLSHGAANANLSLAGSGVNLAGHNLALGNWAEASGGVNLSQGAANVRLGGQNGIGADMNLSQRNLDLNVFGHKIDVAQGIREASSVVSRGAHAAWDFATSW